MSIVTIFQEIQIISKTFIVYLYLYMFFFFMYGFPVYKICKKYYLLLLLVQRLGPQKSLDYRPHVIDASFDALVDIKIIQNLQSK